MEPLNPYKNIVADMTPTEFEKYCYMVIKEYAEQEKLSDFNIIHNDVIKNYDGKYQIDIHATCTILHAKIDVLIECKKLKSRIEAKVVRELKQKIESLNANKGIIISTSGFQSGAVEFAHSHNIALWQIIEGSVLRITNSTKKYDIIDMLRAKHDFLYYVKEYDENGFPQKTIYPTPKMIEEKNELIKEELKCPTIQQ